MISTVTLNPAVDKTIYIGRLVPNDTNRATRIETDAGGKGINCARILKRLGAETMVVTFLGGAMGDLIQTVLCNAQIPVDFVPTATSTRSCIAVEETSGLPPTTFNELGGTISHPELVSILEKVKDCARKSSYVAMGGSIPPGINGDIYRIMVQIIATSGSKAVLDAEGEALSQGIKSKPFMIKPNRDEAERLLGTVFESKSDVARGALKIAEMGIELVVISLGKQGLVAAYQGEIYEVVSPEVKVVSSVGSGDSLVAGILFGLERCLPMEECLRIGAAAGAATAMSNGADIGSREDIDKLIPLVKVQKLSTQMSV